MNSKLVTAGIFAFVLGIVLWINFGSVFPSTPHGYGLLEMMLFEFVTVILIFGGGALLFEELNIWRSGMVWVITAAVVVLILIGLFALGIF
ncbi:MAG: hypothetical protein KGH61_05645 [Candidatus Micrarchaeota archaeon]|nr:hypothetical protein [Candidatus Micrarchaeota archaeon]MDE1848397.1 hypothetical protein [Candidatus Micrarchaeota archaeon]